jgi:mannose-6-phosphate isomerase-like protein (cupin superfamily)
MFSFQQRHRLKPLHWAVCCAAALQAMAAADRQVDPTFLSRRMDQLSAVKSTLSTSSCRYYPAFGEGTSSASSLAGITRFGRIEVDANGGCASISAPKEDQVYVVLSGSGTTSYDKQTVALNTDDYLYLPAGVPHALKNASLSPLRVLVMGFRTSGDPARYPKPLKANINDVRAQPVSGHPSSTLYRLLMGDSESKRDRIAAGHVLTSLFVMEIPKGGTNFPHHHEREEEIYLVLSGHGDMVAGGGQNGIEGRHPARAGDTYFFRLNCTVGYYSAPQTNSRILAVRSWYPGMAVQGAEH